MHSSNEHSIHVVAEPSSPPSPPVSAAESSTRTQSTRRKHPNMKEGRAEPDKLRRGAAACAADVASLAPAAMQPTQAALLPAGRAQPASVVRDCSAEPLHEQSGNGCLPATGALEFRNRCVDVARHCTLPPTAADASYQRTRYCQLLLLPQADPTLTATRVPPTTRPKPAKACDSPPARARRPPNRHLTRTAARAQLTQQCGRSQARRRTVKSRAGSDGPPDGFTDGRHRGWAEQPARRRARARAWPPRPRHRGFRSAVVGVCE